MTNTKTIKRGAQVRAYDFRGDDSCYFTGVIIGRGTGQFADHWKIQATSRTWGGMIEPEGRIFYRHMDIGWGLEVIAEPCKVDTAEFRAAWGLSLIHI